MSLGIRDRCRTPDGPGRIVDHDWASNDPETGTQAFNSFAVDLDEPTEDGTTSGWYDVHECEPIEED